MKNSTRDILDFENPRNRVVAGVIQGSDIKTEECVVDFHFVAF